MSASIIGVFSSDVLLIIGFIVRKKNFFQEPRIRFGNLTTPRYFINTRALILTLQLNTGAINFFLFYILWQTTHRSGLSPKRLQLTHTQAWVNWAFMFRFSFLPLSLSFWRCLTRWCVFFSAPICWLCVSQEKKKKKVRSAGSPTSNTEQKRAAQRNSLSIKKKGRKKKSPDQTALRSSTNNCRRAAISCLINNQSGGIERETAKGLFVAGVNNKTSIKKKKKKKVSTNIFSSEIVFLPHPSFLFFFFLNGRAHNQ